MDFNNKIVKNGLLIFAVFVCALLYYTGIFRVPALIVILIIVFAKNKNKMPYRSKQAPPPAQQPKAQEFYTTANSVCPTSNSDDEFCHNEHQAQRMTADAARSELQELKSLLDSGMMDKTEYDQRVSEIKAVL